MDGNILPNNKILELRNLKVLTEDEVAYEQGDLLVALNVVTQERRVINSSMLSEEVATKRLLKG